MDDHHEDVHEINGPRQRLHPQFQGREVYEYHQAHQPRQDGLTTNNCILIVLLIFFCMVLGVWLYQCNMTEKDYTKINEKLVNCQEQLNDIKLLLKDEQKKVENLQNDLKSEQDNHQTCKIELAKCGVYKERPRIEGEGVNAGWEEKYKECIKHSEGMSEKLEKCNGNNNIG